MPKKSKVLVTFVAAIAVTTLLVGAVTIDTGVTINAASAAVKWPNIVTGTLNSAVGGPVKAIPFGTALTETQLKLAEPTLVRMEGGLGRLLARTLQTAVPRAGRGQSQLIRTVRRSRWPSGINGHTPLLTEDGIGTQWVARPAWWKVRTPLRKIG